MVDQFRHGGVAAAASRAAAVGAARALACCGGRHHCNAPPTRHGAESEAGQNVKVNVMKVTQKKSLTEAQPAAAVAADITAAAAAVVAAPDPACFALAISSLTFVTLSGWKIRTPFSDVISDCGLMMKILPWGTPTVWYLV